jgi:predicted MFS family arabinose efflux permease
MSSVLASAYVLVDSLAPASVQTEAFAWISTALYTGGAAGTALAGQLIAAGGPSRSLLAGLLATVACSAVILVWLRYLRRNQ